MVRGLKLLSPVLLVSTLFLSGCVTEEPQAGPSDLGDDVTLAEYKQALESTRNCLEEAGYSTSEPYVNLDGILWSFGIDVEEGADQDVMSKTYDSCRATHIGDIEKRYFAANLPSAAERDVLIDELIECLDDIGVSGVTHAMKEEEIVSLIVQNNPEDPSGGFICLEGANLAFPDGLLGQ